MKDPEAREDGKKRRFGSWISPLLAGLLLAVLCLAGSFRRAASDVWWSVTHRRTALAFGESFPLPFPWRQVESRDEHAIELREAVREIAGVGGPDQIVIREAQNAFDAVDMAQRWERLETRSMIPGDRLEPTPKDAFLRERYRCSDIKRSRNGRIQLACFDKAGRWVISLHGREGEIKDLAAIMRGVTESSPAGGGGRW